jgi:hypothetical protein
MLCGLNHQEKSSKHKPRYDGNSDTTSPCIHLFATASTCARRGHAHVVQHDAVPELSKLKSVRRSAVSIFFRKIIASSNRFWKVLKNVN